SVIFHVVFTNAVTGLSASNFTLAPSSGITGANITNVSGSGNTWTVTVNTGSGDATLGLNLTNSTGVTDSNGNAISGLPFTGPAYAIEKAAAVGSSAPAGARQTNAASVAYTVTFNHPVTGGTARRVNGQGELQPCERVCSLPDPPRCYP